MKKVCIAIAMLLIMLVQYCRAAEDQPLPKSACEKLLASCKDASLKAPSGLISKNERDLASFCFDCEQKCTKEYLEICAKDVKANPKERENFDSFKVHHLNCVNKCKQ